MLQDRKLRKLTEKLTLYRKSSQEKEPWHYYEEYFESLLKNNTLETYNDLIQLLYDISTCRLDTSNDKDPYQPLLTFVNGDSTWIPEKLTKEQASLLEEFLKTANCAYLNARIYDILWLHKRQNPHPETQKAARQAIAHYTTAKEPMLKNVERALQIAKMTNNKKETQPIIDRLIGLAKDKNNLDDAVIAIKLIKQYDKKNKDIEPIIDEIHQAILQTEPELYNGIRSSLLISLLNNTRNQKTIQSLFKSLSEDSEILGRLAEEKNKYCLAQHHYTYAYKCLNRTLQSHKRDNKRYLLLNKIVELTKQFLKEMIEVSTPLNINNNPYQGWFIQLDRMKLNESVIFLASAPEGDCFISEAETAIDSRSIADLIYDIHKNEDDLTELTQHLQTKKSYIDLSIIFFVRCFVNPTIEIICAKQGDLSNAIKTTCQHSKAIKPEQQNLFYNAIIKVFEKQYEIAIYLVCAALESAIIALLKQQGMAVITQHQEGKQELKGIKALLKEEQAKAILGENLVNTIEYVFYEQGGLTIRHTTVHGRLTDDRSTDGYSIYAWWLLLRLVIAVGCRQR